MDTPCDFPAEQNIEERPCVSQACLWRYQHRGEWIESCPHPQACRDQARCIHPR